MADIGDNAQIVSEAWLERAICAARGEIPQGNPGDCDRCGEHSTRLINGACASCRDKYRLP